MSYDVSVMCDVRKGNRLLKQRCHSDAQTKVKAPSFDGQSPRLAMYGVNQAARNAGWLRFRRPGVGLLWICPVCKDTSNIAGLAEHLAKESKASAHE